MKSHITATNLGSKGEVENIPQIKAKQVTKQNKTKGKKGIETTALRGKNEEPTVSTICYFNELNVCVPSIFICCDYNLQYDSFRR